MPIWKQTFSLEQINAMFRNTLSATLGHLPPNLLTTVRALMLVTSQSAFRNRLPARPEPRSDDSRRNLSFVCNNNVTKREDKQPRWNHDRHKTEI